MQSGAPEQETHTRLLTGTPGHWAIPVAPGLLARMEKMTSCSSDRPCHALPAQVTSPSPRLPPAPPGLGS